MRHVVDAVAQINSAVTDDVRELSIKGLGVKSRWELLMEWWNNLTWLQKAFVGSGIVVGVGGTTALILAKRRR